MKKQILTLNSVDGYNFHYRYWDSGIKKTLLLVLHGGMSNSSWFGNIGEKCQQNGISLIAPDRRGSGLNKELRGDIESYHKLIGDIGIIVNKYKSDYRNIHLVGWCWGGPLAFYYTLLHNEKIKSIIFIAPGFIYSKQFEGKVNEMLKGLVPNPAKNNMHNKLKLLFFLIKNYKKQVVPMPVTEEMFTDNDNWYNYILNEQTRIKHITPRFAKESRKIQSKFTPRAIKNIAIPILLILAEKDEVVDNTSTEDIFKQNGRNLRVEYIDTHHGIHFEKPDDEISIIKKWIDELG